MRGGGDAAIIAEWRRLASLERNPSWRADFGALALTFAGLAKRKSMWQTGLEGWNVRDSTYIAGWLKEGELKGWNVRDSTFIAGWLKEGELKAQRKTLLRLLQLRWQNPIPSDLVETVNGCEDLDDLGRWIDQYATANTSRSFAPMPASERGCPFASAYK